MTLTRSQTSELLARHGLAPRRMFGQNFVVEPETVRRIASLARVGEGDHVLEIGAGLGALTLALAETGARVTAVEIDDGLVTVLRENVASCSNVQVVHGDAMRLEWESLLAASDNWTVVANLPYNVATPLVADLLDGVNRVKRLLVMVQKEVAQRFVAKPGDEAFGAVSVKVDYWATARVVGEVSSAVFLPRPRVASSLVEITRRESPAVSAPFEALFQIVKQGFATRRKMLRRALDGTVTAQDFEVARVNPQARAEELSLDEWSRLTEAVLVRTGGVIGAGGEAEAS
ncbi:MAG: 16S rRNA (adenine(1518)-N(6)/adenine(1519)-N(6))-dimethyltransferase RsmA [Ilumatobacteraceae bacterium]